MRHNIESKYFLEDIITLRKYPMEIVAITVFKNPKNRPVYSMRRLSDGIVFTTVPEKEINKKTRIVPF